ncbi:MAG: type II toxin-antitoxin system VapC family toxin [Actinomycetota bacterium]|nr:type II toxin-antitoxin system VapC family toxin [Actinomycetota bacterium]
MIADFGTSSIIPLLIDEPSSSVREGLWDDATRVVSVRLLHAESRAALARARRLDRLAPHELRAAAIDLERTVEQIDHVEVTDALVREAGELAEAHGLRGYDAVHLAAALSLTDAELVFVTGDRALADAATDLLMSTARTN